MKQSVKGDDELFDWLGLDDWIIRQRNLGVCGDGPAGEQRRLAVESYKAAVVDRTMKKKLLNNQWCIGVFRGGRSTRDVRESGFRREKAINDTVDHDACNELFDNERKAAAAWKAR